MSSAMVVPADAECPFLMAIYQGADKRKDIVSEAIRVSGKWELRESSIIEDLPENSLVVDIGANIGWHSLLALSLGHSVIAFEPMAENVQLLQHSLCLNPGLNKSLSLHQVAITEKVACHVRTSKENRGDGILLCDSPSAPTEEVEQLPVVVGKLDDYIDVNDQVDLLKIDVEGHELAAVRSGERIFTRTASHDPPRYVITEYSPTSMKSAGYNPIDYLHFFHAKGYRISYRKEADEKLKEQWRKGFGSPKANTILRSDEFQEFTQRNYDGPVTLEMSID